MRYTVRPGKRHTLHRDSFPTTVRLYTICHDWRTRGKYARQTIQTNLANVVRSSLTFLDTARLVRAGKAPGNMQRLPLTQDEFAIVDDDVFEWASQFKWSASFNGRNIYAMRHVGRTKGGRTVMTYLHRDILEHDGHDLRGKIVRHRDGNKLNCQRENLVTASDHRGGRSYRVIDRISIGNSKSARPAKP